MQGDKTDDAVDSGPVYIRQKGDAHRIARCLSGRLGRDHTVYRYGGLIVQRGQVPLKPAVWLNLKKGQLLKAQKVAVRQACQRSDLKEPVRRCPRPVRQNQTTNALCQKETVHLALEEPVPDFRIHQTIEVHDRMFPVVADRADVESRAGFAGRQVVPGCTGPRRCELAPYALSWRRRRRSRRRRLPSEAAANPTAQARCREGRCLRRSARRQPEPEGNVVDSPVAAGGSRNGQEDGVARVVEDQPEEKSDPGPTERVMDGRGPATDRARPAGLPRAGGRPLRPAPAPPTGRRYSRDCPQGPRHADGAVEGSFPPGRTPPGSLSIDPDTSWGERNQAAQERVSLRDGSGPQGGGECLLMPLVGRR